MHKFTVAVGSSFPVDEQQIKCSYFSKGNMHSPFVNQKWNQSVSGQLLILNHKSKRIMPGFNILWEPSKLLTSKSLSVNCYNENLVYTGLNCVLVRNYSFLEWQQVGKSLSQLMTPGWTLFGGHIIHFVDRDTVHPEEEKPSETFAHSDTLQMCLLTIVGGLFQSVIRKGMTMRLLGCTPEPLVSCRKYSWIMSGFISIRMNPMALNRSVFPGNAASNIILSWYIHVCRLT